MPAMTITIESDQRDGLYELVRNHRFKAEVAVVLLRGLELWERFGLMGTSLPRSSGTRKRLQCWENAQAAQRA
jgi:hypothetical protein